MIVASDTSPLTSLAAIGQFELLRRLYGEIHIAQGVWHELNHGGRRHPGSHEVEKASWVHRHEESCLRLVRALAMEQHENWIEATRYLNMDLLREHRKQLLRQLEMAA